MANVAKCSMHMDCFANRDGRCGCLKDNDFGGRDCPFYKSSRDMSREEIEASCRAYTESHGGNGS